MRIRNQKGRGHYIRDEQGRIKAVALYQQGYKPKEIANMLGNDYSTICKWLKENNLGNGFSKIPKKTVAKIDEIGQKHLNGATYKELAEEYGLTYNNVIHLCWYNGYGKYDRVCDDW